MIKRRLTGPPLFFALLLSSAALLAQPAPEAADSANPQAASPPASANPAGQPAPAAKGQVTTPAPATSGKDSPFDYRSSEEISEDVPVSFPVDI